LIDTPGLVDGHMNYPFEPEDSLVQLVTQAELVFFFFDPIGQALCARTMNVVEKICEKNMGHKTHFYLSKADTVPDETDRQRVLVQIAQNLTYRLKDRQFSLNIPPIYIPTDEEGTKGKEEFWPSKSMLTI
jgi:GTP1/Obg family GTP-binding protein